MSKIRTALRASAMMILVAMILTLAACGNNRDGKDKVATLHGAPVISYSDSMLDLDLGSPQAFVYDVSNDTVIYTKGQERVVYPGSTTKLLTALYVLTLLDPDEVITPGNELELVKAGSSVAYIKSHHSLSVEMLIEGMLIPSGNDAAYVLAAAAGKKLSDDSGIDGKKAVELFMTGLRRYADEIGLCGTALTVPDGYAFGEHYTTTEDMLIVSHLALENEIIKKYASMSKDSVVYASGHTNEWTNTNKLLDKDGKFYSKYVTGLKTGSIDGEYSLIFSVELEDGRRYIAGVFGSDGKDDRFYDALKIIGKLK